MRFEETTNSDRVRAHTDPEVLQWIDETTAERINAYADAPRHVLSRRIQELEREWDIERVLEMNASTLALSGVVLGMTMDRRWLYLSAGVLSFLLMHAIQGWCPPVPLFRRMGIRTQSEIDYEKASLQALRGDFDEVRERHGVMEPDPVI